MNINLGLLAQQFLLSHLLQLLLFDTFDTLSQRSSDSAAVRSSAFPTDWT